jgi:hypothetical protein
MKGLKQMKNWNWQKLALVVAGLAAATFYNPAPAAAHGGINCPLGVIEDSCDDGYSDAYDDDDGDVVYVSYKDAQTSYRPASKRYSGDAEYRRAKRAWTGNVDARGRPTFNGNSVEVPTVYDYNPKWKDCRRYISAAIVPVGCTGIMPDSGTGESSPAASSTCG